MDYGHWLFNIEFTPAEWFGFIYKITELNTGREYIGKKQFFNTNRKIVKDRKNRKKVISESNWKAYTGSSEHLNAQISLTGKDNYKFEIMSLHKTKGSLHYAEVEMQVKSDVLRAVLDDGITKKYFNRAIPGVKFIPPTPVAEETRIKISKVLSEYTTKRISTDDYEKWITDSDKKTKLEKIYGSANADKLMILIDDYSKQKLLDKKPTTPKRSAETKEKLRKANIGKHDGKKNNMYGKPCYHKMDDQQIEAWKKNISKATKGKPKTPEHAAKIGAGQKGKPKITLTCPHCNKVGRGGNMKRYHFDNCNSRNVI